MPTVQVKRTGEENGGQAKRPRKEDVSPTPQPVAALPPAAAPPSSIVSPTPAAAEEAKAAATKAPIKKTGAPAGKKPVTPTQRKRKSGGGAADGIARGGAVESNEEWGRMYGVLKKFMTQHDNAFPGAKDTVARDDESGEHDTIGLWCISQRERRMGKRPGPLSDVQVEKLDALGFDWDAGSSEWDRMFGVLKKWVADNGGAFPRVKVTVPKTDGSNKADHLGTWCVTQRQTKKKKAKNKAMLSPERIDKLNSIGFDWDPLSTEWHRMYGVLKKWLAEHDNKFPKAKDSVPRGEEQDHIGTWCVTQRQTKNGKRKGKLSDAQIQLLDDIGFVWSPSKLSQKKADPKSPEPADPPAP